MTAPVQQSDQGTNDGGPITGIGFFDVTVRDIDAAINFYERVIPLRVLRRWTMPAAAFGPELVRDTQGEVEIASASATTGTIRFMHFPTGAKGERSGEVPVAGPGYTHVCLQSPATDPALPKFLAAGGQLVSRCDEQGVDLGGYGVRYGYARDPEGRMAEIEILDNPRRTEAGWITHLANVVHDFPAMIAFYRQLLGFEPWRTVEQSARPKLDEIAGLDDVAIKGAWFRLEPLEIEVWHYLNPPTPKPAGRHYLDEIGYNALGLVVPDLNAQLGRLRGLGVRLIGEPIAIDSWLTQYALDPEGNLLNLQQRL